MHSCFHLLSTWDTEYHRMDFKTQNIIGWTSTHPGEGVCHCKGPSPTECIPIMLVSGICELLRKVFTAAVQHLVTTTQVAGEAVKVVLGAAQVQAFQAMKTKMVSPCLLTQYDPRLELILACDTSPYGVRAVLSHRL